MDLDTATPDELLQHASWLRALALRLARDEAAAEDLVQSTWVAALTRPPARIELRRWLARALERSARHMRRGEHRRRARERIAVERHSDRGDTDVHEAFEAQRSLAAIVDELSEPGRTLILRRYYKGQSAAEIARASGVPAATVRSRLARARAELRARWSEIHGHDRPSGLAGLVAVAGVLPEAIQKGALMKSVHKGALAAVLIAVVGLGIRGGAWMLTPGTAETEALEVSPPVVPTEAPQVADRVPEDEREERRAVGSDPTRHEAPVEAQAEEAWRLLARILDEEGRPIDGASLSAPDRPGLGQAESEATGQLELPMARELIPLWTGRPLPIAWRIVAEGHATHFLRAALSFDSDTDLGDIQLGPGGSLAGRVLDDSGAPLAGVRLLAGELALGATPERARLAGPENTERWIETSSDRDGSYRLDGVAVGSVRIWAHLEGRPWGISDPLQVTARSLTHAPDLILPAGDSNQVIAGFVLGPDGRPFPRAVVTAVAPVEGVYRHVEVTADEAGRFELVVLSPAAHRVEAFDPEAKLCPTHLTDVLAGDEDLELRLTEVEWLEVTLLDATTDQPLNEPWVHLDRNGPNAGNPPRPEIRKLDSGVVLAPLPREGFYLATSAKGYRSEREGPFEPETIQREISVRLERLPHVSGRVLAGGMPVEGARVQTMSVLGDTFPMEMRGFRSRLFDGGSFAAHTAEDGSFEHPINLFMRGAPQALVVSMEGWATVERVLDVPDEGLRGLEIVLTKGGAIEGEILLPHGQDPRGALITASRGDGAIQSARADEQGVYRLEHLTPGLWELRHQEEETQLVFGMNTPDSERRGLFDCQVVEGQTTRLDIDQRRLERPLEGRLQVDGKGAAGWTARLERLMSYSSEEVGGSVLLDATGSFSFESCGDATHLTLEAPDVRDGFVSLRRELEATSVPISIDLAIERGRLTGSATPDTEVRLTASLPDGWHYRAVFSADSVGRFSLAAPAGEVGIATLPQATDRILWIEWPAVVVPRGGEVSVEID